MSQWSPLFPFLGPVIAALIAAAVAFIASVLSKEQKTSEFRQAWIDALRSDLADLVSHQLLLQDILATEFREKKDADAIKSTLRSKHDEFLRMEAAIARVRLRLNPAEHKTLLDAIHAFGEISDGIRRGDVSDLDTRSETVICESQRVLKSEWQRVKRGEVIFRVTKWTSLALVLLAAVIAISLLSGKVAITYVP